MDEQIRQLVEEELARGNAKNGPFVDSHQAYAVLLEEVEEAEQTLSKLKNRMDWFWREVKEDWPGGQERHIADIEAFAFELITEAIQVAAMARKTQVLIETRMRGAK